MKNSKTPQVILITGGSSGIGFETARVLARQGHRVYAAARRIDRMEALKKEGVSVLFLDVTDDASMCAAVDTVLKNERRIDVLVNNAGYGYFGPIEEVPMSDARQQLEVNVFGMARMCQLVLPTMRQQGAGRIVNISSIAGKAVFYMGGWYHVSKYAVEALSDALRIEMRPFGITVSLVEPGLIKTDWGLIAAQHLQDAIGAGPYEETGGNWSNSLRELYSSNWLSSPTVITRMICRAVNSPHPRSRYCRGRAARLTLALHALLSTRCWDALMRRFARIRLGKV